MDRHRLNSKDRPTFYLFVDGIAQTWRISVKIVTFNCELKHTVHGYRQWLNCYSIGSGSLKFSSILSRSTLDPSFSLIFLLVIHFLFLFSFKGTKFYISLMNVLFGLLFQLSKNCSAEKKLTESTNFSWNSLSSRCESFFLFSAYRFSMR